MQKILILAAVPNKLRLDKEIREIEDAIRRAANRDLFEIKVRTAVRPQDIRRALAEEQPHIVHFCGHGLEDGSLQLEDDGGNDKLVSPDGLSSLFELHTEYVKCVLLNACYSSKAAETISRQLISSYVIGMNQPIEDRVAIVFAQGFYDGLGYKTSNNQDVFQRAFNECVVAIKLENYSNNFKPILYKGGIFQEKSESRIITEKEVIENQNKLLIQSCNFNNNFIKNYYIDYTKLQNLLESGRWEEADKETFLIMLKIAGRENDKWLRKEDIKELPCKELCLIDQFWRQYSNERFGLSTQQHIWLQINKKKESVQKHRLIQIHQWFDFLFNRSIKNKKAEKNPQNEKIDDNERFRRFAKQVGWLSKEDKWIQSINVTLISNTSEGYLPYCARWLRNPTGWKTHESNRFSTLMSRIECCKLQQ